MGGLFSRPRAPDMGAVQREADERLERERREAALRTRQEQEAQGRVRQGRGATLLTSERDMLNRSGLLS